MTYKAAVVSISRSMRLHGSFSLGVN